MTATALQTFGVNSTILSAYLPQVGFEGADDLMTLARVTQLVEDSSSEVCGYLVAAGIDVATLAADTSSGAYKLVQRVIVRQCIPLVLLAVGASVEAVEASETRAAETLARLLKNPALLGYDEPAGQTPCAWTATDDFAALPASHPSVAREWALTPTGEPYRW